MILKLSVNNQSVESSGITRTIRMPCANMYGTALRPMQPLLQLIVFPMS